MITRAECDARDERVKEAIAETKRWFKSVAETLSPLAEAMAAKDIAIADAVTAHVMVAEALASTDVADGAERLWAGDAGQTARSMILALSEAATEIPAIEPGSYPVLFRSLAEERAVRPTFGRHPRLAILGPLEARLLSFDLVVLGGLNEDSWPRAAATDAWLSRPMREKLGLEQPERAIGLAAHDFAVLASAPRVVLTRALKAEGSPTVASRWWQRLVQLTRGLGLEGKLEDAAAYAALARALGEPETRQPPIRRPDPRPPVEKRPRSLSVTEIETWLRDPYAIYAKHILRLRPLDPLDSEIGPLERGTAVHTALERFLEAYPDALPPDAELKLIALADAVFDEIELPRSARALWYPRFVRASRWFVGEERKRRLDITHSFVEIKGTREFAGPAGTFTLRARADRVDVLKAGGGAIVDYKTGNPPTKTQVSALLAPQLPLEGAILAEGGFADVGRLEPAELVYIRFGGGAEPGEVRSIGDVATLVKDAEERLIARIAAFDSVHTPYVPRVMPFRADMPGDYDHLARVREWSLTGWEGDEE